MIIQTQDELNKICAELATKPYIALDTEFLRDKTYYAKLCLLQIAAPDFEPVALDPLKGTLDLSGVFQDLMLNNKVVKVFHAARQDLEIFYQMSGALPHPIFDTQVAAMVCGYGDSIAYTKLVQDLTGQDLNKSSQFTDWSKRPLAKSQIEYALDDVRYLRSLYEILSVQLKNKKREKWVEQEMAILTNPQTYDIPLDEVWKRIKIRSEKPEILAVLRELAKWREEIARAKDIPRSRVIKDEALTDIALYLPKDKEGLSRIRNVPPDVTKSNKADTILNLIDKARRSDRSTWPKAKVGAPFPKEAQPIAEMLKLLLKINGAQADVATKLIADSEDIEEIATKDTPTCAAMSGWRYDIFGKDALALKAGKIMLGLKDGKVYKHIIQK